MNIDLIAAAKKSTSEERRLLFSRIAGEFISGIQEHTPRELLLFSDILCKLVQQAAIEDRIHLSLNVAERRELPHQLAMTLARDELPVASPVLEKSPVLSDDDLVEIAQSRSLGHRQAISLRPHLSAAVTDVLVSGDEEPILQSVAQNRGAMLSDSALRKLSSAAARGLGIHQDLLDRLDVPAEFKESVAAALPEDIRAALSSLAGRSEEEVRRLFEAAKAEADSNRMDDRKWRIQTIAAVREVQAGEKDLDECLLILVEQGRIVDTCGLIGGMSGFSEAVVHGLLLKEDVAPIALLCRSLEILPATYGRILRLRASRRSEELDSIPASVASYEQLDDKLIKRVMRFIKVHQTLAA